MLFAKKKKRLVPELHLHKANVAAPTVAGLNTRQEEVTGHRVQ